MRGASPSGDKYGRRDNKAYVWGWNYRGDLIPDTPVRKEEYATLLSKLELEDESFWGRVAVGMMWYAQHMGYKYNYGSFEWRVSSFEQALTDYIIDTDPNVTEERTIYTGTLVRRRR